MYLQDEQTLPPYRKIQQMTCESYRLLGNIAGKPLGF